MEIWVFQFSNSLCFRCFVVKICFFLISIGAGSDGHPSQLPPRPLFLRVSKVLGLPFLLFSVSPRLRGELCLLCLPKSFSVWTISILSKQEKIHAQIRY